MSNDNDIVVPWDVDFLNGMPDVVDGNFDCSNCLLLKSFKGAPRKISGNFSLTYCTVKNLKGAPEKVGGDIIAHKCENLKNLKGAPEFVGGSVNIYACQKLKNLKGAPKIVEGDFSCISCYGLKTLDGAPEVVKGKFNCGDTTIKTVEFAPKKCKVFDCRECPNLENLNPLLRCDIEEVMADEHLLELYNERKKIIEKHGFENAMVVFETLDDLI